MKRIIQVGSIEVSITDDRTMGFRQGSNKVILRPQDIAGIYDAIYKLAGEEVINYERNDERGG